MQLANAPRGDTARGVPCRAHMPSSKCKSSGVPMWNVDVLRMFAWWGLDMQKGTAECVRAGRGFQRCR